MSGDCGLPPQCNEFALLMIISLPPCCYETSVSGVTGHGRGKVHAGFHDPASEAIASLIGREQCRRYGLIRKNRDCHSEGAIRRICGHGRVLRCSSCRCSLVSEQLHAQLRLRRSRGVRRDRSDGDMPESGPSRSTGTPQNQMMLNLNRCAAPRASAPPARVTGKRMTTRDCTHHGLRLLQQENVVSYSIHRGPYRRWRMAVGTSPTVGARH